ncbi:MAG: hypothetical protein L6V93_19015 [Clostridiales bacterium]|nr:MAG: hypothetical protein L6V93_19015 [Clostridiales bacterium]
MGSDERKEILQFSEIYRSKIVDVAPDTVTVEITGTTDKIASFLALVEKWAKSKWCARVRFQSSAEAKL